MHLGESCIFWGSNIFSDKTIPPLFCVCALKTKKGHEQCQNLVALFYYWHPIRTLTSYVIQFWSHYLPNNGNHWPSQAFDNITAPLVAVCLLALPTEGRIDNANLICSGKCLIVRDFSFFISYFRLLVFGILVTLVAWFSALPILPCKM